MFINLLSRVVNSLLAAGYTCRPVHVSTFEFWPQIVALNADELCDATVAQASRIYAGHAWEHIEWSTD